MTQTITQDDVTNVPAFTLSAGDVIVISGNKYLISSIRIIGDHNRELFFSNGLLLRCANRAIQQKLIF